MKYAVGIDVGGTNTRVDQSNRLPVEQQLQPEQKI